MMMFCCRVRLNGGPNDSGGCDCCFSLASADGIARLNSTLFVDGIVESGTQFPRCHSIDEWGGYTAKKGVLKI